MFKGGVFFDNAAVHIKELEGFPDLLTIKIPESPTLTEFSFEGDTPLAKMIRPLGGNIYLKAIRALGLKGDQYDPVSGIQDAHLAKMISDYTRLEKEEREGNGSYPNKYVIFDWDRTLTMFEGIFPTSTIESHFPGIFTGMDTSSEGFKRQYREDMLIYLFGGYKGSIGFDGSILGKSRLDTVRGYINWLFTNGIGVFILTNNGACDTPDFDDLVKQLDQRITNIICSGKKTVHGGDKGKAVTESGFFSGFGAGGTGGGNSAASSSGGRRRKSRKQRRHKKRNRTNKR